MFDLWAQFADDFRRTPTPPCLEGSPVSVRSQSLISVSVLTLLLSQSRSTLPAERCFACSSPAKFGELCPSCWWALGASDPWSRAKVCLSLLWIEETNACRAARQLAHHLISSHLISSHLISSHLISSHLISSHLISSHLISSHLISSHLISSHLISSHLISSHLISSHLISSHLPQICERKTKQNRALQRVCSIRHAKFHT